ncbi:MAG TPA: patatin-like phospholipase family protein, partial [Urbifossiella sp.]|nr:patatin-like phospholipase family protein [Urbifossiella sp.]
IIDPAAQAELEQVVGIDRFGASSQELGAVIKDRLLKDAPPGRPPRNVLCLSGGGSYGAYSAGVLVGWTQRGDRPCFDVVTGISTGALIAPFAFLGPAYDAQMHRFYTTLTDRDIFKKQYVRGLLGGEAFTDTGPLRKLISDTVTPEMVAGLADAHRAGRRLILGTTEEEGRRFVVWDVGHIASRNGPGDRELIISVMLGSAAIPGVFPPSRIDVSVDGVRHTERHGDGGVSQALFFYPPYVPPELRDRRTLNLVGTNVYVIVAGKLYADPEVINPSALALAGKSVSTMIYAQTRGDLQRLWTFCLLNGMDYHQTAIPAEYAAAGSSGTFDPVAMTGLFEEGRRAIGSGRAWRTTPPELDPSQGELPQARWGRCLTFEPRGPQLPIAGPRGTTIPPRYPGVQPASPPGGVLSGPVSVGSGRP